jgi:uncharacterized coiled-coil DUF342 family protein
MTALLVPIVVAIIMAGPTWWSLRKVRTENTNQHLQGRDLQNEVLNEVRAHRSETNDRFDGVHQELGGIKGRLDYVETRVKSRVNYVETEVIFESEGDQHTAA